MIDQTKFPFSVRKFNMAITILPQLSGKSKKKKKTTQNLASKSSHYHQQSSCSVFLFERSISKANEVQPNVATKGYKRQIKTVTSNH